MKKQPAKVNYFFGEAYVEIWDVICTAMSECGRKLASMWELVAASFLVLWADILELWGNAIGILGDFSCLFVALWAFLKAIYHALIFGFALGRFVLSAVLTPLLTIFFSAVQIVASGIMMLVVYIGYMLFAFADWIYRRIKRISSGCPNCQEKYDLPTYICECGAVHTRLVPSKYGIFKRECECGRLLSTTFLNGRQKLPGRWVCPHCNYQLDGAMQVDISIPVIGGPSCGKTCYVNTVIAELEKNAKSEYQLNFQYKENLALGDDYEDNKAQMSQGKLPFKTNDTRLKYYQFYLTPEGEPVKNLISLCDVAGEAYEHSEELGGQIGFKNANGFLMLIDPLSVTAYRESLAEEINLTEYGASERPMDEVLDAVIHTLENMNCTDSKSTIKTNVAVVFTKCDLPGLDEKIGRIAVENYLKEHECSVYEARNQVCEQFLREYEEENFLLTLKAKFKSMQFFTCTALGHVENGELFTPADVEEPVLWLIDKASPSIDLTAKWEALSKVDKKAA